MGLMATQIDLSWAIPGAKAAWIESGYTSSVVLMTVSRLTATQIVCTPERPSRVEYRFRRADGSRIGEFRGFRTILPANHPDVQRVLVDQLAREAFSSVDSIRRRTGKRNDNPERLTNLDALRLAHKAITDALTEIATIDVTNGGDQ